MLRIYDRYAREVVESFDFCPWAVGARLRGTAQPIVIFQRDLGDFEASLQVITDLAARPQFSVGLLIYPCFAVTRLDFEHFVRRLRHADSTRYEPGRIPFAMAAFHPQAEADLSDPDRLVPFIRRSPDPTLQLVRQSALESMRGEPTSGTALAEPWMMGPSGMLPPTLSIRERIAQNNLHTVQKLGPEPVEAVLADIRADRERSYAELTNAAGIPGLPDRGTVWAELGPQAR